MKNLDDAWRHVWNRMEVGFLGFADWQMVRLTRRCIGNLRGAWNCLQDMRLCMEAGVVAFGDGNFGVFLQEAGELDHVISFMEGRLNLHKSEIG